MDEKLKESVAVKSMRGNQSQMDEVRLATVLTIDLGDAQIEVPLFGIFDGQGGKDCAAFLKEKAPAFLKEKIQTILQTKSFSKSSRQLALVSMLETAFVELGRDYRAAALEKGTPADKIVGSTACIALQIGEDLYVANVGNSRAILSQDNPEVPVIGLTVDAPLLNANPEGKTIANEMTLRGGVGYPEDLDSNPRAEVTVVLPRA